MKIKIDIEGCSGEGKSTIAQLIKLTLETYGLECSYEDIDGIELSPIGIERNLMEMSKRPEKYQVHVEIETIQELRSS
jgi:ABC-type transport system involved in cytochrome bd biosynthesis fused ATPase/permease subunit